jgi:hypothetical protein
MKRAGVMNRSSLRWVGSASRKSGYVPNRETVWHLVDTVDAMREVVDRYLRGWQPNYDRGMPVGSWWHQPRGLVETMSQAEQLVVHDRVVDSEAPAWWATDSGGAALLTKIHQSVDVSDGDVVLLDSGGGIEAVVWHPERPDRIQWHEPRMPVAAEGLNPADVPLAFPYYRRVIDFVYQRES